LEPALHVLSGHCVGRPRLRERAAQEAAM
jgi:hypothetical protein